MTQNNNRVHRAGDAGMRPANNRSQWWSSGARFGRLLGLILAGFVVFVVDPTANAQDDDVSSGGAADPAIHIGIQGHYRVGHWSGVRVNGDQPVTAVETRDGDGVEVRYGGTDTQAQRGWTYVIPGSEAAPLIARDNDQVIASTRFPTAGNFSRGPAMVPMETPWLVIVGDALGVDEIGVNQLLGRDALLAVSKPQAADDFPDSARGYDGVNMMVFGGSSRDLLSQVDTQQQEAIVSWVENGGRLLLTLGESGAEMLDSAPWLRKLLPAGDIDIAKIDPSAIETFTSSQTPLDPFSGVLLPKNQGRIMLLGRTTRRISTPIAVEYNIGFGRLTVIAADLESDLFAAWPERLDLLTQLTGSILLPGQEQQARRNRSTAYNDLAGQVRASLDQFSIKRPFGFSLLSLILMALIAAIGPLDYLLINRVFGKPLLGWFTFPIVAIGLSALLVYESRPIGAADASNPIAADQTRACNRIEIVDIDATRNLGRSFTVNYLYSHEAAKIDVRVNNGEMLDALSESTASMLTVPFGFAGESFGGVQIAVEDSRLPVYDVAFQRLQTDGNRSERSSLLGMPLASRSSKAMVTRSLFTPTLSVEQSINRRPGSELVQGQLVNPLPVDLLNGMLIYRNWIYILPTRFAAGDTIASLDSLRQKNFRWYLSRQQTLESEAESQDWNPAATDMPKRVAEMLMFHRAVGGQRYTSLRDDPLSYLDLSHVLGDSRCILMGSVAEPATRLDATIEGQSSDPAGSRLTFIRLVLPVEAKLDRR